MFNKYVESLFKFYFCNFLISLKIYKDINLYKNLQSIHRHPRPRRNGKSIEEDIVVSLGTHSKLFSTERNIIRRRAN